MDDNGTNVEFEGIHSSILDSLKPFYGKSRSEVIQNLVIRWIEEHIGTESIRALGKAGAINLPNENHVIHLHDTSYDESYRTVCGKYSFKVTENREEVTCPTCLGWSMK